MGRMLRQAWARLRRCPDREYEPALIRPVLGSIACAILFLHWDVIGERGDRTDLVISVIAFYCCALALLAHVYLHPRVLPLRRYLAIIIDVYFITTALFLGHTSVTQGLSILYLWITVGNGLRFGKTYLHAALGLSILGFTFAMSQLDFWRENLWLGIELLFGQVLIALYVRRLVLNLDRAREAAEQANRAKTTFIATASHDLRQPMQALSLYTAALNARRVHHDDRILNGIQLSVQTLEQLFDSLLDVSKMEAGVMQPTLVSFPLQPLLEKVVALERPLAVAKNIHIELLTTPISVRSDPILLERILINLVTNAVRYTEQGRVVLICEEIGFRRARIMVTDSGIGISLEHQKRIFERFYRARKSGGEGSGLGLSIVKNLAESLGYEMKVESTLGAGSCFSLELDSIDEAVDAATNEDIPHTQPVNGACVALVDDDPENRESMAWLLSDWGCQTICAPSLSALEEQLHAGGFIPDLVISDYELADGATGDEVLRRIRILFGSTLPVLLFTGRTDIAVLQNELLDIPVISKPVHAAKLRAFIVQALR